MIRFGCMLLAALLVGASVVWWGAPVPSPSPATDRTDEPEAVESAAAADPRGKATPPAVVSPPPASPQAAPSTASAEHPTPALDESEVVLVDAPAAFPEERGSDAPASGERRSDAADTTATAESGASEAPETMADAADAPSQPVDVERSGDLVRRMLVLYEAMRE